LPIGHSSQKHPQSKFTLEQLERRHKALLNARTAREKKERATERRSKKALSEAKATRAEKQRKKAERKVDPKYIAMMETMEAKRKKQRKLRERVKMKRISNADCDLCALKAQCCPKDPQRKILRSIHEGARDMARDIAKTEDYKISCKLRKKVEMLFAHLKRILRLGRLRLRGPCGAKDVPPRRNRPEPQKHGKADPDARSTSTGVREMTCVRVNSRSRTKAPGEFLNKIDPKRKLACSIRT
jgi:hypothetical protein